MNWRDVQCPSCAVEPGRNCVDPKKTRSGTKTILTTWPRESRVQAAERGKVR